MKTSNIKIKTQLILGFAIILVFVLIIWFVALRQTSQLHDQTETMYNHPLQVRRAISTLEIDILEIRLGVRDLILANTDDDVSSALLLINNSSEEAREQFDIIRIAYLGPQSDIDNAYDSFLIWEKATQEDIQLALSIGDYQKIRNEILDSGELGILREKMLDEINIIDNFAEDKSKELYLNSQELYLDLNRQLTLLITTIILLSLLVGYVLQKNIRYPLKMMNEAVSSYKNGDFFARSHYNSTNEFGVLSDSINQLANLVQKSNQLNQKSDQLSKVMLSAEEPEGFFRSLLISLNSLTNSQMAAIYLLDKESHYFKQYDSIGFDSSIKKEFSVESLEGEFGQVIINKKIQLTKLTNDENRFIFLTTSGQYVPKEIMTIPLISSNKIEAIISLASIGGFSEYCIELIERNLDTISARIEGVLAYQAIKEYRDILENQNQELDTQKNELVTQKIELSQQNVELEIQKNQITEASRLKTSFLSNMSHELRTPLNSVIALSGVLNRRLANLIPEEEYSYLEIIERNGKNLLLLINDILDISRIESGFEEVELTSFDLCDLLDEVIDLINPIAKQKGIDLINHNKLEEYYINSDKNKCRHILQNIIGNAVKFTEQGKVEVKLNVLRNHLSIHVIDEGIGISEENIKHIFDEFRQADASTSRKYGGTGLGLAIAKKYVTMIGGQISVKSKIDSGSEFIITLPINYEIDDRDGEFYKKSNSIVNRNHHNSSKELISKNILLVEDSESAVIQIKDLLQETGHQVMVAHDAFEAFDLINVQIPDAIILDLMMPGMDGFDVLESIRNEEKTANVPVLILTAKHITKEELKKLRRNNIHQLIQKGDVNRVELQNAVHNMLFPIVDEVKTVSEKPLIKGMPLILIVEDNVDNLITTKALLDRKYNVVEANDGLVGIELANHLKPDLILMDISLPNVNGIEAFKSIRNTLETSTIPIIALTASALEGEKEEILSHGFNGFISKPINEKEFLEIINEALYGR